MTQTASVQSHHPAGGVSKQCPVNNTVTPKTGSTRFIDISEEIHTIVSTDTDPDTESEDDSSTNKGIARVQVHSSSYSQGMCNASVLMSNNL